MPLKLVKKKHQDIVHAGHTGHNFIPSSTRIELRFPANVIAISIERNSAKATDAEDDREPRYHQHLYRTCHTTWCHKQVQVLVHHSFHVSTCSLNSSSSMRSQTRLHAHRKLALERFKAVAEQYVAGSLQVAAIHTGHRMWAGRPP